MSEAEVAITNKDLGTLDCYLFKNELPVGGAELGSDDSEIKEGGTASYTFARIKGKIEKETEQMRQDLAKYYEGDTLTMVEIFRQLKDL